MSDTDEGAQRDGDVSLTAEEIDTYKLIAAGEDVPADRPTARLVELGLVADDPYREGRHVALDPRGAAQHLMAAEQAVLSRVIKRIAQIPELEALAAHFEPHRLYGGPGSEFLVSKEQMNVRIGQVIGDAQRELWTAQPGPAQDRDPEVLKLGVSRAQAVLDRGIAMRSLYDTSVISHDLTRGYLDDISVVGGVIRVHRGPFPRMVLVDQRHLFIDNCVFEDSSTNSGWHVFDRSAVMWARYIYTMLWSRGVDWQRARRDSDEVVTNERQRQILQAMEAGLPQPEVGREVGLSERAVNKELATLRKALGFRSTYQLMAWWGRAPDRRVP